MERGWALEAAREDLVRISTSGHDSKALRKEFLRRLNRVIPFDSAWFALCDPSTLLFTDSVRQEMPHESTPRFVEDEFLLDDFNKWVDLARVPIHARSLAQATGGTLASSFRFREILAPMGLGDELRAALVAGNVCWGFICLHRGLRSREFAPSDASGLDSLAPTMAAGLRASLLFQSVAVESEQVGVIVLSSNLSVVAMSATAESWLAEISDADWPGLRELPSVVLGVASRLIAKDAGRGSLDSVGARLRSRRGVWLTVRASRLASTESDGQVAVILAPTAPIEMAPVIMHAYDLTPRERDVTGLVLKGESTKRIGLSLRISEHTVQQHLKAIFDKTGVHSRRELAAQIFAGQYQPRLRQTTTVGADGWFTD